MKPPIKLFWWRWRYPYRLNFGDEFSASLVERLTGRPVEWASAAECDVVAAGSILQMVLRDRGANRPAIWGSGFIREPSEGGPLELDIRAVRGERTLDAVRGREGALGVGDLALGDPGILASHLLEGPVRKRYGLGVIPHYTDANHPVVERLRNAGPGVRVLDVAWTPEEVAREIASCEAVISSSLHGLIFADSLGVPNMHMRLSDKVRGGLFKFQDYYSIYDGPDRYCQLGAEQVAGASSGELERIVHEKYTAPEGLERLQKALIRALPA